MKRGRGLSQGWKAAIVVFGGIAVIAFLVALGNFSVGERLQFYEDPGYSLGKAKLGGGDTLVGPPKPPPGKTCAEFWCGEGAAKCTDCDDESKMFGCFDCCDYYFPDSPEWILCSSGDPPIGDECDWICEDPRYLHCCNDGQWDDDCTIACQLGNNDCGADYCAAHQCKDPTGMIGNCKSTTNGCGCDAVSKCNYDYFCGGDCYDPYFGMNTCKKTSGGSCLCDVSCLDDPDCPAIVVCPNNARCVFDGQTAFCVPCGPSK